MTNILYFHNTIRDDESVSTATEEESPSTSRFHTPHHHHHHQHGQVVASSSDARISLTFGLNLEDENKYGKDVACGSNEKFSSTSVTPTPWSAAEKLEHSNLMSFSLKELKSATRKFHHSCILGEGLSGTVFKAWIDVNKLTATKPGMGFAVVIKTFSRGPSQSQSQQWSEVKHLGRLYHPNLVRLFGYCSDKKQHLLVCDFMPRGSLNNRLFERDSSPLSWSVRMKIALGAAKGLAFLHSTAVNVIHRGLTSSNILLDLDYNAKLSEFGLPRDVSVDMSNVPTILDLSTKVARASAFLAPEYACTGLNADPWKKETKLTAKSDVYSFGAVLIEILSGRCAIDMRLYLCPRANKRYLCGKDTVLLHPYRCSKDDIFCFLDSHLAGQYSRKKALKAANLALQCLAEKAEFRPNMDEVVATLEELQVY